MKKMRNRTNRHTKITYGLILFGAVASNMQIWATIAFDNGGGDYLLSNPTNWVGDRLPTASERINIFTGTSATHPALVDPNFLVSPGLVYIQDAGGAYAKILSGATLNFSTLYLGNGSSGTLTVGNGGTLYDSANTGAANIGQSSAGGKLTMNAGATVVFPNLFLGGYGTLEYVSSSTGLASIILYGDAGWSVDGLVKVDLTAVSSGGTFVLMQHDNDNSTAESMVGNLRSWLNAGSGTQGGTGSGIFSMNGTNIFEVVCTDRTRWVLSYDESSGSGRLVLSVDYAPAARLRLVLISFLNVLYPIRLP